MLSTLVQIMSNGTKWVRMVVSSLLGMFGIVVIMGGLSVAFSDPTNDEFGTIAAIVGLLFSFVAWRLWPSSNPRNNVKLSEKFSPESIEIKLK